MLLRVVFRPRRILFVPTDATVYPEQPHGFFNYGRDANRWYDETVTAADHFFASLGWLSGEPTLERTANAGE